MHKLVNSIQESMNPYLKVTCNYFEVEVFSVVLCKFIKKKKEKFFINLKEFKSSEHLRI